MRTTLSHGIITYTKELETDEDKMRAQNVKCIVISTPLPTTRTLSRSNDGGVLENRASLGQERYGILYVHALHDDERSTMGAP